MPLMRRKYAKGINYFASRKDRLKLANYLKGGNFKRLTGPREISAPMRKKRIAFCILAGAFLAVGAVFALF